MRAPVRVISARGRLIIGAASLAGLIGLLFVPAFAPWVLRFEHWTADWRTALFSQRLTAPNSRIAIVAINDETLRDYVSSPIDRSLLARIVTAINAAGARAIGLDVFFLKKTDPDKDAALIEALQMSGVEVVLGAIDESGELQPFQREFQSEFLTRTGRRAGYLNLKHERDDVVRYQASPWSGSTFPDSFARLLAKTAGSHELDSGLPISWLLPPTDGSGRFLVIPAQDLLAPQVSGGPAPPPSLLKDRIVLVGGDFPFRDRHRTPLSVLSGETMPGVMVHAHILANMLDPQRGITELDALSVRILLVSLAVVAFLLGWHLWQSSLVHLLGWSFATAVLVAVDALVFIELRILLPFTLALAVWALSVSAGRSLHAAATMLSADRLNTKRGVS